MKRYTVEPEHLTEWGNNCTEDTIITGDDVMWLSQDWEVPVPDLLEQLIYVDGESCISVDNGHSFVEPAEALQRMDFETIAHMMDDSLCEYIHDRIQPDTDLEFLTAYLDLSPSDLVIG